MSLGSVDQSANEIQRQMSQIRRDLDEQVDELVDSARQLTDWRAYVAANPWPFLGVAAGLGYLMVPTRVRVDRPVANTLAELARNGDIRITRPEEPATVWTQLRDLGLSMAGSVALQVGLGLVNRVLSPSASRTASELQAGRPGESSNSRGN